MTCREAQALITKYVQGQLDLKILEEFLQHVNNCPDCKEELEVYYIVFNGIKRLDEDENIAVDYHKEFEAEIKKNLYRIKKAKRRYRIKEIIYVAICLVAIVICSIRVGRYDANKPVYKEEGPSTYELPYQREPKQQRILDQYVFEKFGIDVTNSEDANTNINVEVRSNQ